MVGSSIESGVGERKQSSKGGWVLAVILALVAGAYWSGLGNGFVWLDQSEILEGALIVEEWSEVPALFSNDRNNPGYHRPIYSLMHSFDRAIWGERPFGFLLSSLLLQLANVALVFLILRRLKSGLFLAGGVALFWGLHPINSAVVGLIHAKADLLFVFGLLSSVWWFGSLSVSKDRAGSGRGVRAICWGGAALGLLFALLSKENALLFAVVLTLLAIQPRFWLGSGGAAKEALARAPSGDGLRALRGYAVLAWALTLVVILLRVRTAEGVEYPSEYALGERLLTFAGVYVGYIRSLVLPIKLSICDTVTAWSALEVGAQVQTIAAAATAIGLQLWGAWKWPWLRPWVLLFNIALAPVTQLIPVLHFRADRFLYLPSLAFVGAVVEGVSLWLSGRASSGKHNLAVGAGATLLLLLFGVRIQARLLDYRNDQSLFTAELSHTPDYLEGLSVLGRSLDQRGEHEAAGELLRLSLADYPGRISYLDRGGAALAYSYNLLARGQLKEALAFLKERGDWKLKPAHREELDYNLAVAQFRSGETAAALAGFEAYHSKHPTDPSCLYFLGRAAMIEGDAQRAERALREYLQQAPGAPDRTTVEAWLKELAE